jgi:hypothetical protein
MWEATDGRLPEALSTACLQASCWAALSWSFLAQHHHWWASLSIMAPRMWSAWPGHPSVPVLPWVCTFPCMQSASRGQGFLGYAHWLLFLLPFFLENLASLPDRPSPIHRDIFLFILSCVLCVLWPVCSICAHTHTHTQNLFSLSDF